MSRHVWLVACALAGGCNADPARLCDGSDGFRLVYHVDGGGPIPATTAFTTPSGWRLLAVDGKCRYHASENYLRGYVAGTLTEAQAQQLERDFRYNEIDYWVSRFKSPTTGCPDGGTAALHVPSGSVSCTCSCPDDAPIGLADVLGTQAEAALERVLTEGEPLAGPVSAAVAPDTTTAGPRVAWPLDRATGDIENLMFKSLNDERLRTGPYASFEGDEAGELRALRSALYEKEPDNHFAYVAITEEERALGLFVRDEWPEDFLAQVEAFRPDIFD